MVCDGYVFPPNLDTPSAVTKVLLQEAGKMKASQVKKGNKLDYEECASTQ